MFIVLVKAFRCEQINENMEAKKFKKKTEFFYSELTLSLVSFFKKLLTRYFLYFYLIYMGKLFLITLIQKHIF